MIRFCTHQKATKSTKSTKSTEKHKKHKSTKSTKGTEIHQKAQKRNQAKAQNGNRRTKIKNALKNYVSGKRELICLFAFLCFL